MNELLYDQQLDNYHQDWAWMIEILLNGESHLLYIEIMFVNYFWVFKLCFGFLDSVNKQADKKSPLSGGDFIGKG